MGSREMLSDFVHLTNDCNSGLDNEIGPVKINISVTDFMQIWLTLVLIVNSSNVKMCQKMKRFGFSESGVFSPFI